MSLHPVVALRDVSFTYDSALETLIAGLSIHFPTGFTGIVGANGSGKTTLLELVAGVLTPEAGSVVGASDAIYCEQRTDFPPARLSEFLEDWSSDAFTLRRRLGIDEDFLARWDSLSHGERKRVQIAHALWQQPSVLVVDEPTNHIDAQARDLLVASLKRYEGVGLIVSHDRELLNALCVKCLWLEPPAAEEFSGGFSEAQKLRQQHRATAIHARNLLKVEQKKFQRDVVKKRETASREHSIRSKRGLSAKDSDAREKIDRARVTDSKGGQPLRQLKGKGAQLQSRLEGAVVTKEYDTGIWLPGSRSRHDALFTIEAGEVPLGGDRRLAFPQLHMKPTDRIALTGFNGSGKSTLIRHILTQLNLEAGKLTMMPQEVSAAAAWDILQEARLLKNDDLGHVLNIVSRLGSRPQRLLASANPSPGEVRKLLLALGMVRAPHLIVMDEPTNHLDLPSIEALEAALAESPCGLLLVSHDQHFLGKLATTNWHIEVGDGGNSRLRLD